MNLPFPSGKYIDQLSLNASDREVFRVKCSELDFSLSGVQNKVQQYFERTKNEAETAAYALRCMSYAVCKATENAVKLYPDTPVVFSGGVASNSLLRSTMAKFDPIFSEPRFSTDNALGVAVLTHRALEG